MALGHLPGQRSNAVPVENPLITFDLQDTKPGQGTAIGSLRFLFDTDTNRTVHMA